MPGVVVLQACWEQQDWSAVQVLTISNSFSTRFIRKICVRRRYYIRVAPANQCTPGIKSWGSKGAEE